MSEKDTHSLPFESGDPAEQKLWAALSDLPRGEPSSHLRQRFYSDLHKAASPRWTERLNHWLGLKQNNGWITVAACLLIGFFVAQVVDRPAPDAPRLVALEESLALLQRDLILDRLQDASASTRLRGVVDASQVAAFDQQVAHALLDRAAQDQSLSVRSAAIDALGSQLGSGDIGVGVMKLLDEAESPIVQLALVDLILRNGDAEQLRQLQERADSGLLHPDLVRHVNKALKSQSI